MKKVFQYLFFIIVLHTIVSCNLFGEERTSSQTNSTTNSIGLSDSAKRKIVEQSSQMKILERKVDSLSTDLSMVKNDNEDLNARIKDPQNMALYVSIGALVLSLIAIFFSFFRRGLNEHEVKAVVSDRLDESKRIKDLQYHVNTLLNNLNRSSKNSQMSSSVSQNLELRIQKVEKSLRELTTYLNTRQDTNLAYGIYKEQSIPSSPRGSDLTRSGYANINSGKYFTKILDSNQETCVFSIKFNNDSRGEFTIISLNKIKSRNGWQEVVEYTGSIEEATSFKVVEPGICEKCDENSWQVTKPLKITLQ